MGLSNELSCEAGGFSCCRFNPHRCFQSVVCDFIYPHWNPRLHALPSGPPAAAHSTPQSATSLGLPGPALPGVLPTWLPVPALPAGLDECFFLSPWLLDFHTVRFSVSSGCFLFLNCVVLLWVVRGGTVCLPTPPSWPEV